MGTKEVAITVAQSGELTRILAAYKEWGYGGGIAPDDTAWLAEIWNELIGVVWVEHSNQRGGGRDLPRGPTRIWQCLLADTSIYLACRNG